MSRLGRLILLLFVGFSCSAQDLDSLISVAENSPFDSTKARLYSELSEFVIFQTFQCMLI